MIEINVPIWRSKSFGIAEYHMMNNSVIRVRCNYADMHGNLLYPHTYIMESEKAMTYPRIKCGPYWGREIPINDFEQEEDGGEYDSF